LSQPNYGYAAIAARGLEDTGGVIQLSVGLRRIDHRLTVADAVYDAIKSMIIHKELISGQKLDGKTHHEHAWSLKRESPSSGERET
jgi:hypothetical protein